MRTARGRRGVVVQPYRGYGSAERIFVIGRVFWQRTGGASEGRSFAPSSAVSAAGRCGAPGSAPASTARSSRSRPTPDGYFRVEMAPAAPMPRERIWHRLALWSCRAGGRRLGGRLAPAAEPRLVVVSDMDDTVMVTGVVNKAAMLLAALSLRGRRPHRSFPGVSPSTAPFTRVPSGAEVHPG